MIIRIFSIIFICSLLHDEAIAIEFSCPSSITTNQSIAIEAEGFNSYNQNTTNYLDNALFSDGHPENRVFLHPNYETNGKISSSTWLFENYSNVYIVCLYRMTSILISKPIDSRIKKCTIFEDKSKGIVVEQIKCE